MVNGMTWGNRHHKSRGRMAGVGHACMSYLLAASGQAVVRIRTSSAPLQPLPQTSHPSPACLSRLHKVSVLLCLEVPRYATHPQPTNEPANAQALTSCFGTNVRTPSITCGGTPTPGTRHLNATLLSTGKPSRPPTMEC